jgi:hypothetical protein
VHSVDILAVDYLSTEEVVVGKVCGKRNIDLFRRFMCQEAYGNDITYLSLFDYRCKRLPTVGTDKT